MGRNSYSIDFKLKAVRRLNADFEGNVSKASREMGIDRKQLGEWSKKEIKLIRGQEGILLEKEVPNFHCWKNNSFLGLKIKGKVRIYILLLSTLYNI